MSYSLREPYFSMIFQWVAIIIGGAIIIYFASFTNNQYVSPILAGFLLLFISTTYEVNVNKHKKTIRDSFKMFWLILRNDKYYFSELESIVLTTEIVEYNAAIRVGDGNVRYEEYVATLRYFDESGDLQNFEVYRKVNWKKFSRKMQKMSKQLGVPLNEAF